ncbi:hypothetical protein G6R29_04945 [Fructobacillus sp. M2-14]|uniref:Uncharacterized protein n=1 Tax=Fructobacillus broussonetiae TaxID=2713173 RepID=A0ABS5R0L6_9LACO|nr:hypothetical protein [Fructobacillus broussonetiae]MBS9338970.1 hypothetical protein [Fructobacillus broussonetiae]
MDVKLKLKDKITAFFSGIGYLNFVGSIPIHTYQGETMSPEEEDYWAIYSDWKAVGDDMRWAMRKVDEEIGRKE